LQLKKNNDKDQAQLLPLYKPYAKTKLTIVPNGHKIVTTNGINGAMPEYPTTTNAKYNMGQKKV
jgi:hypothetical protein